VQTGSMYDNPFGAAREQILQLEKDLPAEKVAQAIYGKYVENSGLTFAAKPLQNLFYGKSLKVESWYSPLVETLPPLTDKYGEWSKVKRTFIGAADLARQNDYTVIMVFDTTLTPKAPAQLVWYERMNRVSWESIYERIAYASVRFRTELLIDSTGMGGDVVKDELGESVSLYELPYHCAVHALGWLYHLS